VPKSQQLPLVVAIATARMAVARQIVTKNIFCRVVAIHYRLGKLLTDMIVAHVFRADEHAEENSPEQPQAKMLLSHTIEVDFL
jgi:hypothetical protein